jgi:transposase
MKEIRLYKKQRKDLLALEKTISDKTLAIRIRIILALNEGYKAQDVARILLIDRDTVTTWKKKFLKAHHLSDWLGQNYRGYNGKLTKEQKTVVERFVKDNVITDCAAVVSFIKESFSVHYTRNGVTKLLHRMRFVYKDTVIVPGKADVQKQTMFAEFYDTLKKGLKRTEKILFMDGVHPTHNTHKVKCWVKKGENKIIKTNTGRTRLNIQGAYDTVTAETVTMFSETINAVAAIAFFDKIQRIYAWATTIYLICDNASTSSIKYVT